MVPALPDDEVADALAQRHPTLIRALIQRNIQRRELDAAQSLLDSALGRWSGDLGLLLIAGEISEKRGDPSAAHRQYHIAGEQHPDSFWPSIRRARLMKESGDAIGSLEVFEREVWTSKAPDKIRDQLLNELTSGIERLDEAEVILTRLAAQRFNWILLVRLGAIRAKQHHCAAAIEAFERADPVQSLPQYAQDALLDCYITQMRFAEAIALAERLRREYPDVILYHDRLCQALHYAGEHASAGAVLEQALARWPDSWRLLYRFNRLALPAETDRRLLARVEVAARAGAPDSRWMFQFALALLQERRLADAIAALDRIRGTRPVGAMAEPVAGALATERTRLENGSPRFLDDRSTDVAVVRVFGATATVIIFAGLIGRLSYLPHWAWDVLLQELPINLVYLRDLRGRAFLAGVAGLGSDEPETVAALRRLVDDFDAPRLVTLGASSGGYAAVRYAVALGADTAISFSGPTTLAPGKEVWTDDRLQKGASVARMTVIRGALHESYPGEKDILPILAGAPETRVVHAYGAGNRGDAIMARRIARLRSVQLWPVEGSDHHASILTMVARRTFTPLIADVVG